MVKNILHYFGSKEKYSVGYAARRRVANLKTFSLVLSSYFKLAKQ